MFLKRIFLIVFILLMSAAIYRTMMFEIPENIPLNAGEFSGRTEYFVLKAYSEVPEGIRRAFEEQDWKITITNEPISSFSEAGIVGNINGLTQTKTKTIFLSDKMAGANSLCHEMAHFIDYYYDWPSKSDEFLEIYKRESKVFRPLNSFDWDYQRSNPQEFFASVYAESVYYPLYCSYMCPEAYSFVLQFDQKQKSAD